MQGHRSAEGHTGDSLWGVMKNEGIWTASTFILKNNNGEPCQDWSTDHVLGADYALSSNLPNSSDDGNYIRANIC